MAIMIKLLNLYLFKVDIYSHQKDEAGTVSQQIVGNQQIMCFMCVNGKVQKQKTQNKILYLVSVCISKHCLTLNYQLQWVFTLPMTQGCLTQQRQCFWPANVTPLKKEMGSCALSRRVVGDWTAGANHPWAEWRTMVVIYLVVYL